MSDSQPLVTVITPTYNQGQFIAETIESVLAQDYPHLEYIIVDGNSADNTVEVIKQYENDPRLTWISEPDNGMSHALNKGIRMSNGEYLTWLNSDDVYIGQAISEVMDFFFGHPDADIVYGDAMYTDAAGNPTGKNQTGSPQFNLTDSMSYLNSVPQPGTIWHRRVTDTIGDLREDLPYVMDLDYWVRAYLNGFKLMYYDGVRATYRLHDASKTMTGGLVYCDEREMILDEYLKIPDYAAELAPCERFIRANLAFIRTKIYQEQGNMDNARKQATIAVKHMPRHRRSIAFVLLWIDTHLGTGLYPMTQRVWASAKGDSV